VGGKTKDRIDKTGQGEGLGGRAKPKIAQKIRENRKENNHPY